jgi:hypothetical protein
MQSGRSPGAWSGSEFLSRFVDVVNNLAVAWCESSPRASARAAPESQLFTVHPFVAFPQGGGGERAMLPSVGAEHGVSSELLMSNPSGRPSPVR